MNIFVLDYDPKLAALYHNNKHLVKMIIESTQLLNNAYKETGETDYPDYPENRIIYNYTHYNHPCSKWVRKSLSNWNWLLEMAIELCKEYTYRYERIHKCESVIYWMAEHKPNLKDEGLTAFAQAMPDKYKDEDAVKAYRAYYIGEKSYFCKWKKREEPYWYKAGIANLNN